VAGDKNQPNYCCAAYESMKLSWQIMADTCAGTPALREKRDAYLPPEPAEQTDPYNYRLRRAIFFNAVDLTLAGLVGMVFRNDPKLSDNVPEQIRGREAEGEAAAVEGEWENIDNAGTHGTVFCKEVFTNAVRDGHAAILVDMPPALQPGATLADEKATNRRPYWVSYKADQIINWRTAVINGKSTLVLIVFKECVREPDGEYGQKEVIRYRVLRPGMWELYREEKSPNTGQMQIVFEDGGPISLSEIPVAFVYSRKCGIAMSQPPLIDLAYTNIAHYQKNSDYSIYLHIASRPVFCTKGSEDPPIKPLGPYTRIHVSADGDVWFAETTGAALGAAREDLLDLKEQMSIMGLSLLVKRTGGPITATEEKGDQIEESSDLATWARSLKDAIELALRFHVQYRTPTATTGGNVEVGATLDAQELTPEEMTAWSSAVAQGQYSVETMWDVFAAGGKLPDDFDPKIEKKRLEEEAQKKQDAEIAMQDAMARNFDRGGAAA
jgi:Domain of unknown function (DUF4055)